MSSRKGTTVLPYAHIFRELTEAFRELTEAPVSSHTFCELTEAFCELTEGKHVTPICSHLP